MNKIQKTLYIKGMHCASCEMLVKQSVQEINGVKVNVISANAGKMDIEIPNNEILPQIEKAIQDLGYQVLKDKPEQDKKEINRKHLLTSVIFVSIFAFIFYRLNITQYLPSIGDNLSL
ncbi:MAG: heavy metal-associated domain-containing protein [bacterium]